MVGVSAEPIADADDASRRLFDRIGDFLADHALGPDPVHYAFAYHLLSDPDGPLAGKIAKLLKKGRRLTPHDIETLIGDADVRSPAQDRAASQGLVARTQIQVEGFEDMVRAMKVEAEDFGHDLAAGAEAIRRTRDVIRIDEVVDITGAMVDRVRTAESRLEAATHEASELRQKLEEARDNARRDPLTDLPNRRALEEAYAEESSNGGTLCLAMCDIDRFKAINDKFGHAIGDRVLKAVGETLSQGCGGHMVARHGGEEFAILFARTALADAMKTLERARTAVATKRYRVRETKKSLGEITFSAGLTTAAAGESFADLFVRADRLLYAAKADGRNCLKTG